MVSISLVKRRYRLADGTKAESKTWYAQIRWSNPRASYLRDTGSTARREAQSIANRLAREIEENELRDLYKPRHTLEGMFSTWIEESGKELRSGKDIKWQITLLLEVMGGKTPIKDISNKTIHEFVQGAKERKKSHTVINRCLTRLRATLNYAARKWEAPVSNKIDWPSHFGKEPKVREIYLSPEDARRFMERLPNHIALAMAFSLYTGMRLTELSTLTWEQIDFDRGTASVDTKGGGRRTVWLSKKAVSLLELCPRQRASIFDLENRRKHWERVRKEMGRPEIHWHDLRAMTATWARQYAGKDLRLIGQAMGHSDTKVTERYARVVDREIATMLDMLPDLGEPMQAKAQIEQTSTTNNGGRRRLMDATKSNRIKEFSGRGEGI